MYVHSCISMTFGKILMYIIFPSNIYRILRTMQSRVVYGMCTCRFSQQPTVSDDLTTSWSNGSPIALASSKNQPRVGAAQVWNALRFWIARVAWQLAGFCAPTGNTSAKPFFLLGKKRWLRLNGKTVAWELTDVVLIGLSVFLFIANILDVCFSSSWWDVLSKGLKSRLQASFL